MENMYYSLGHLSQFFQVSVASLDDALRDAGYRAALTLNDVRYFDADAKAFLHGKADKLRRLESYGGQADA
ncbi:MAG: hypothetical protein NTW96_04290 [Planctomycetia bacterium]|nr:hypothetical protein [Planctomycetia bacterium]